MKLLLKYRLFILFLFCFLGCSSGLDKDEIIVNRITAETAKKLEQEKKLVLIGTGGGMMHCIRKLSMGFQFFHEVELEEARELVVYAVREYLSAINSNEEVRPYLCNYPFTAKDIEINIWIYNPDRSDPALDKIYYISAINGILSYYLDLPETYSRKSIHKETYEEALKATEANSLRQHEKTCSKTTADGMGAKKIPSNT